MTLDLEACYRAFASRDRRFDGRFVTAVTTTRIYCRPGCPARLPARRNVRFYACAAAAESAGFRPCLRCRPDRSPGSPPWLGTSATVARALRLIEAGALETDGVDALAARLGVTDRWLRELFDRQLGASPLAVERTRRVHFARRLLETTRLPIVDVAIASGFASARRLHAAVHATYRRPPRALRAAGPSAPRGGLELKLPVRAPHDLAPVFAFLAARAIPGVERGGERRYARTIALDGERTVLELAQAPGDTTLTLRVDAASPRVLPRIVSRVSRLFDLGADPIAIAATLRRDPALRRLVPRDGVRVPQAWEPFELGVRGLLGQQVSVAAARTLAARLVARCGVPLERPRDGLTHEFPTAAAVAAADLDGLGLTGARVAALRAFARAVAERRLDFDGITGLDDAIATLTALPGIGEWTAHYVAMRALGEPDAFPAGDLGVRKALADGGALPATRAVIARAERWRPWRAYAVIAMWTHDSNGKDRR